MMYFLFLHSGISSTRRNRWDETPKTERGLFSPAHHEKIDSFSFFNDKLMLFLTQVRLQVTQLQAMPPQAGQRPQEQIALELKHLVPHPLQVVSEGPDGMKHQPVKWVVLPPWLAQVGSLLLELLLCRCRRLPQDKWPWHQNRCKHIAGKEKLMNATDTSLMRNLIHFSPRRDIRFYLSFFFHIKSCCIWCKEGFDHTFYLLDLLRKFNFCIHFPDSPSIRFCHWSPFYKSLSNLEKGLKW